MEKGTRMKRRVACLCPTFMRPRCTANAVALFNQQTYENRFLYILDDGNTYLEESDDPRVKIKVSEDRFESLPAKYNYLLDWALKDCDPHIIVVWENDDIFLPNHLEQCVTGLVHADVLRFARVFVYDPNTKKVRVEPVLGNFHGSLAFKADLATSKKVRWPETKAAGFDLKFLNELCSTYRVNILDVFPTYVFRFPCTETINGECFMNGLDDITWYDRYGIHFGRKCCSQEKIKLQPKIDEETNYFFEVFYGPGLLHQIIAYNIRYNANLM